jgi:hypothetical protein
MSCSNPVTPLFCGVQVSAMERGMNPRTSKNRKERKAPADLNLVWREDRAVVFMGAPSKLILGGQSLLLCYCRYQREEVPKANALLGEW